MSVATMTSKGQITLPRDVRDDLNLKEGDRVSFEKIGESYVLRPQNKSVMELAGILHVPGERALTIEEMGDKLGEALAEDDARIRSYGTRRVRGR
ncbi:MAG: AbrB/MazE/SpoVT family DNA-binding domain-containing protein [Devosia sp.]|uniref:AbrB/MazE/SpoVT family DNA-binding domain-containing protein n=1 Tax=Devosia sp. TaxID=1871048 RepID=UPI001A612A57|nr:AbrB/MazE/SpoVT family DNA-binding domain-containing protein [Devosia sp.]MBL8599696.1 AbrB/MazE/SpoVT family DNA-binding domain-containing protein [Devosia sp.]